MGKICHQIKCEISGVLLTLWRVASFEISQDKKATTTAMLPDTFIQMNDPLAGHGRKL